MSVTHTVADECGMYLSLWCKSSLVDLNLHENNHKPLNLSCSYKDGPRSDSAAVIIMSGTRSSNDLWYQTHTRPNKTSVLIH